MLSIGWNSTKSHQVLTQENEKFSILFPILSFHFLSFKVKRSRPFFTLLKPNLKCFFFFAHSFRCVLTSYGTDRRLPIESGKNVFQLASLQQDAFISRSKRAELNKIWWKKHLFAEDSFVRFLCLTMASMVWEAANRMMDFRFQQKKNWTNGNNTYFSQRNVYFHYTFDNQIWNQNFSFPLITKLQKLHMSVSWQYVSNAS